MTKICAIYPIGFLLSGILLLAQSVTADTLADLKQAEGLHRGGKYADAEQVYQKILQDQASDAEIIYQVGKALPQLYLATGRLPQAQEAVQQLLMRSPSHEYLPHALHEIIEQAKGLNKAAQAGQICRNLLDAEPQPLQTIWLKMGIALADVYLGNDQAVNADVQDLITRNAADPWASEALAQIGWAYDKREQYDKARPLYEYVTDNWSDKPRALYAHTALVRACIRLNDKKAAQARLEQLVSRHSKDTHLPNVLNEISVGYRDAQMYDEARVVSVRVLDNYPEHAQRIWAERDLVLCDIAQRSHNSAQTAIERLVREYGTNGDCPHVLRDIAGQYLQGRMHKQARSLCQQVLSRYSNSDQCLWAQRDIVLCDLALKDMDAARAGTQALVNRAAERLDALWAVSEVAETYSATGQHEQARELYRFNLTSNPNRDDTIWSLRGFINESIALKDEGAIDSGVKKLLGDYAVSKNLPMAAVHVGRELCKAGNARASELFQYVIDKYPGDEQALIAQVCMGHVYIGQGRDDQAETLYKQILAKYAHHPSLPILMHVMAEGYLDRGLVLEQQKAQQIGPGAYRQLLQEQGPPETVKQYCGKAIERWAVLAREFPQSPQAADALYFTGVIYRRHLNEPEKALPCYERIVTHWPNYRYAWSAQSMIAQCYETLARTEKIAKEEADAKIQQACAAVVERYPTCTLAEPCQLKLAQLHFRAKRWPQAAAALQQFLSKYPDSTQWRSAIVYLGTTFERMGQKNAAAELYRMYLGITDADDHRIAIIEKRLENLEEKEVEK